MGQIIHILTAWISMRYWMIYINKEEPPPQVFNYGWDYYYIQDKNKNKKIRQPMVYSTFL